MSDADTTPVEDAVAEDTVRRDLSAGERFRSPEPEPEPVDEVEDQQESSNAEAAKYRRKLRETEGQLEQARTQLEALQRQHVESLLAATGVRPDAVWAVADLVDLVAEDGTVSAEAVAAAVETARQKFGIAPISKGVHVPGAGKAPSGPPRSTLADAFRPRGAV